MDISEELGQQLINFGAEKLTTIATETTTTSRLARYRYTCELQEIRRVANRINGYGEKVYSQADQDGIILAICEIIDLPAGKFMEFGCGDGENNTHNLLLNGWTGMWLENDDETFEQVKGNCGHWLETGALSIGKARVTKNNINTYVDPAAGYNLISIDTDWNDYWLWEAMKAEPDIIVIEYNASITKGVSVTVPYYDGTDYPWRGGMHFGASWSALKKLGKAKGYILVDCNLSGTDMFFVKERYERALLDRDCELYGYEDPKYCLEYTLGHEKEFGPWVQV